jgi:hypothetical protein
VRRTGHKRDPKRRLAGHRSHPDLAFYARANPGHFRALCLLPSRSANWWRFQLNARRRLRLEEPLTRDARMVAP